ncbi:hypothetical protein AN639_01955 [Candidatus Epulonipiscium fishelsonii]|uniref:Uncharacterized protein n=1 Tax=Candidatus Epulonipiscium fishelsonii TaxID=77094 RepID=A0ACC8X8L0_9FIRM|nr:hypothetical protein AN396_10915 [Epulopiscium sp. SCG-B11WGA-EpuloA1]ONI38968.1 hypothetical protein AN639_01955 [Epulopiscium sp. SCG-B05WGA-EpuloA1]ONI47480.1 hypothetical protein AN644_05135 [Epulopiscium sp. SCG-C06WGA-EpuloA1]
MDYKFLVNGFEILARYEEEDIKEIFIPILRNLIHLQSQKARRIIVFVSAPPAVGKSTLVAFLEHLAEERLGNNNIQGVGIDGFHFYNDYLISNRLKDKKGAIDTFNISKLNKALESIQSSNEYWPIYDRNLHDPIEDQIFIDKQIIILEGNYLNHVDWQQLKKYCDYSIFIRADKDILKERLISRKIRGGLTEKEAIHFYENSDRKNIEEVLNNTIKTDMELSYDGKNYILGGIL